MIEHIFRNINDIRVFDVMSEFVIEDSKLLDIDKLDLADINLIMNMLEYGEYKRLEVEDSVDHLVRNSILGVKKIKIEGVSGCKICKWTDKFLIPRIGEHKQHKPEEVQIGEMDNYYMKNNELTGLLISAVFSHSFMVLSAEEKDEKEKKDIEIQEKIETGR